MSDQDDTEIRRLLSVDEQETRRAGNDRVGLALKRLRTRVGQRDSMLFAVVRIWTVIAEMLAPVFAQLAERRAATQSSKARSQRKKPTQSPNPK